MLIGIIISAFILLVFPIFFSVNGYFSKEKNRLYFGLYVFGFIKIKSGYAEIFIDKITFHFSKKKIKIFYYKNFLSSKNTIKKFYDYHLLNAEIFVDIGSCDNLAFALSGGMSLYFIFNLLDFNLKYIKPQLRLDTFVNVYDEDIFNLIGKFTFVINLFVIILGLLKIVWEKIFYAKRKQNQYGC